MLDRIRLFRELENAKHVLIAGAGGGFDVFAGVPLLSTLRRKGCSVSLANLSFTNLQGVEGRWLTDDCVEVRADTAGPTNYFPERSLAQFLAKRGVDAPVYALAKRGVEPVRHAYETLVEELRPDALLLVDGGTDILMRGDEAGLGTPTEDMTSLAAVRRLSIATKAVCCIGFGIDAFHGVRHAQFLENVATLSEMGGYWGAFSLTPDMEEASLYRDAVDHSAQQTARRSIVNGSIADAVRGAYGDVHRYPERTRGSTLWINPLMSMYWTFDLEKVAEANHYLDSLDGTQGVWDVQVRIEAAHRSLPPRAGPTDIPV